MRTATLTNRPPLHGLVVVVVRRDLLVLVALLAALGLLGAVHLYLKQREAQALETTEHLRELDRLLRAQLAACRSAAQARPTREGRSQGAYDAAPSEEERASRAETKEGLTLEDVGGTRGSSHWLGIIHVPKQTGRNEPPEGEGERPVRPSARTTP